MAEFIAYPKAFTQLKARFNTTTPEELAMWIFMGPEDGGVMAYCDANESNSPSRFYFDTHMGHDYLTPLACCWFLSSDIEKFAADERFITYTALLERWKNLPGLTADAYIKAKIAEFRLYDMHPTFGGTQATPENDDSFPPLSAGLFSMDQIMEIEIEDALDLMPSDVSDPRPEVHHRPKSSSVRQEARKLRTQDKYKIWKKTLGKLEKQCPNKSDNWYAVKIAQMKIGGGHAPEYIRKSFRK